MARKIAWNIGTVAVGALIGLWLYVACSTALAPLPPRAFDRCAVAFMIKVVGIALLVGVVVLVLRRRGAGR